MAFFGRHRTNGDQGYGEAASGQARASVYDTMPSNAWVHRIGFWGGKPPSGSNPTVRLGLYEAPNNSPATLIARSNDFTVSAAMDGGGNGASYQQNIVNLTSQPQANAVRVTAGTRLALAVLGTGATMRFAMVFAANSPYPNKSIYDRTGLSSLPNPYTHTFSSIQGTISAWLEYQVNRQPTAATSVPNGLLTQTNVTFEGTFTDADSTYGDRMSGFQYQVERIDTSTLVINQGWMVPNSGEIANNRFSRAHALSAGISYRWRCQVRDHFNTASAWTPWQSFSINAGGSVDTLGGVGGKQDSRQPTPFTFVYRHSSGLNRDRYQLRILQNGSVLRTGDEVISSGAPNTSVSADWSTSFSTYELSWGANLQWQARARDTGGLWTNWSASRAFHINTAPNQPTNLTPTNSAASPDRPRLRCHVVDDDGDSLTVKARIKNNTGTVLQTRDMTHVGGGWYEYQTLASDLASWGTYRFDVRAFDGTLWTGTHTAEANAQHSSEAVFIYAEVPNVSLTSPTNSETYAGSVLVAWNPIPNRQAWRVVAVDAETNQPITSGDWQVNTSTATILSAATHGLRKGRSYRLFVEVRDTNGLVGTSEEVTFLIDYPSPTPIDSFIALPEFQNLDTQPSSIRLTWEPYEGVDFERYTISRIIDGVPLVVSRITNPNETWFTDLVPPSGVEIEYSIVLSTLAGIDEIDSEPAYATARIDIEHVILQSVVENQRRAILNMDSERAYEHANDGVRETPWGSSAPIFIYGTSLYQTFSGEFSLISDDANSSRDHINALRALWRSRQTICYRDERGRRFFGQITRFIEADERVDTYTVSLEITETTFNEGIEQ